jgi:fibronectin type III domain protein
MQLSAANARSAKGLVKLTLIVLAAGALVTPALGSGPEREGTPAPKGLGVREATATTLSWHWKGDETATSYRVYQDGGLVASTASLELTLYGLECGRAYVLAVEAVDAAGRRSPRATVIASSAPCASAADTQPSPTFEPAPAEIPMRPEATSTPAPEPQAPKTPEQITPEQTPPVPAPPSIWQTAGVFVWHEAAVDPEALGHQLKENGFGWVAVQLHDGLTVDPVEDDWIRRFRDASGLPVGGWGVLRSEPVAEAQLAQTLLARYSLDFYIADAEAEYKYSSDTGSSDVRYARSRQFVDAFRSELPDVPAAVSSYCRADREDIDWQSWADGRFDFLPQAYVNDLGDYVTPEACTGGAAKWFSADAVHPTIGIYASNNPQATPATYAKLLQAAHTVGFSVYLAETQTDPQGWNVLGQAIGELGVAREGGAPLASDPTATAQQNPLPVVD